MRVVPRPHREIRLTNQPDIPPPTGPDGTEPPTTAFPPAPGSSPPPVTPYDPPAGGQSTPVSGQPWSTPSGDPLSPEPYQPPPGRPTTKAFAPGQAPIPQPPAAPSYPPTAQFPQSSAAPDYVPPPPSYGYAPPPDQPAYPAPQSGGYPGGQPGGYPGAPQSGQPDGYPGAPPSGYPGGPGYGPPQRAPRKSSAPIIAVILAVTLLLCAGVATAGVQIAKRVKDKTEEAVNTLPDLPDAPNLPTEIPDLPGLPTDLPTDPGGGGHQITITYEVSGDGPVTIVYVDKLGGKPVRLDNVELPWKFTGQAQTPTVVSVFATRLGASDGRISCRALVDGAEVKQNTSNNGNIVTASCIYFAID